MVDCIFEVKPYPLLLNEPVPHTWSYVSVSHQASEVEDLNCYKGCS
jgi:hypothetical protein